MLNKRNQIFLKEFIVRAPAPQRIEKVEPKDKFLDIGCKSGHV